MRLRLRLAAPALTPTITVTVSNRNPHPNPHPHSSPGSRAGGADFVPGAESEVEEEFDEGDAEKDAEPTEPLPTAPTLTRTRPLTHTLTLSRMMSGLCPRHSASSRPSLTSEVGHTPATNHLAASGALLCCSATPYRLSCCSSAGHWLYALHTLPCACRVRQTESRDAQTVFNFEREHAMVITDQRHLREGVAQCACALLFF